MSKKCFTFCVGGLPNPAIHPIRAKRTADYLRTELEGMIGIHVFDAFHTFLIFGCLNEAIRAKNKFQATGNQAGANIMEAEISDDGKTLTVIGKAVNL